jgi:hypothetical protein
MLGHCLLIGSVIAGSLSVPVLLVIAASFLVFVGMQGVKQLARRYRRQGTVSLWDLPLSSRLFLAAAACLGAIAVLGWRLQELLFWGALSLVLTSLYAWVLLQRKERSVLGEWLGILGITCSAGVAWTAGTGRLGTEAFLLWGMCFLFFGGSVPYVKLRVKQMKAPGGSWWSRIAMAKETLIYAGVALIVVSAGAWNGLWPALAVVPFLLLMGKVVWAIGQGKGPHRIAHVGYAEVVFSTVFAVLMVAAFW